MANHTESCLLCGAGLDYLELARELTCTVCGRAERGHVRCAEGHYVCEPCHGAGFLRRLPDRLAQTSSGSPFSIAEHLLQDAELPMLGCEHAHIAAGAFMQALLNRSVPGVTDAHLTEALERTSRQAIGAYCGLTGVCGIVPALGAAYSVLVGGQCGRGPQTRATMELVSRLAAITAEEAEPGCCKAYLRRCLEETASYTQSTLGIEFAPPGEVVCSDMERHPHGCRGATCLYYPRPAAVPAPPSHPMPNEERPMSTGSAAQARYEDFFQLAYAPGALDARTKILVALGASLAAGCAP